METPQTPQKRTSGELNLSVVRAARAKLEESGEPAEQTTKSTFRAVAKVVAATTTAAKVHRTQRLSMGDAATHSIAEDECLAFIEFINSRLKGDEGLQHLLPITSIDNLWSAMGDGTLLCKLVNVTAPETIDTRAINKPKPDGTVSAFHAVENCNLGLNAAKGIGMKVVNVGWKDIAEGRPHLVLGLIWQLVRGALLSKISLKANPFLIRLLRPGEELEELLKLGAEELLARWVNYHLEAAGCARRLKNFGPDLRDSEIYVHLLSQIDPAGQCATNVLRAQADPMARASYVVAQGERLGAEFTIRAVDIVKANDKLNMGFMAALFNQCPGLEPPDEDALKLFAELEDDDEPGDGREERAFRMWINSLGLDGLHVSNLYEDVKDGLLLLRTMEHVRPGAVDWSKVNGPPCKMVFKRVENTNYAVVLGKSPEFRFSLVGVQGKDLVDGNRKLTLALMWQLMRLHLTLFLAALRGGGGKGGAVGDAEMIAWANARVAAAGGKAAPMGGFGDKALGSGLFLLELLAAVEPRCVNRELLTPGTTDEERMLNARYAIACARKLGCAIFSLPEDLAEVRPKMVLAFVASVMAADLQRDAA